MAFEFDRLDSIFERTDGHCHICRNKLVRKNYGPVKAHGAWEVDHSRPHSKGETDHLNNLYASCVSCNRSKGNSSTRSARSRNGYKGAPYSQSQKQKNVVVGAGIFGSIVWLCAPPQIKLPAALLGAAFGRWVGSNSEPE